jgi:hypothetical protein
MNANRAGVFITWRAVGVILVGVLFALVAGGWRLNQLQRNYTHGLAVVQCESGNEFRTNDQARWTYLLTLLGPPRTDHDRALVAQFTAYVKKADAPRDCDAI